MTAQFRLTRAQSTDWAYLREMELPLWHAIIERLLALPVRPMRPEEINDRLREIAPKEAVDTLVRQVFPLVGTMLQLNLDVDNIIASLTTALTQEPANWTASDIASWTERVPLIQTILRADVVVLTFKAIDLSYEHGSLLRNARILTDLRPIFSRDPSIIQGAVISHTLRLRFDDLQGEHSITLAADLGDIVNLKKECERAIAKSATLEKFAENAGTPPLILGDV